MPRLASLSIILRRSADSDDQGVRSQRGDERHGMPTLSVLEVLRVAGAPVEIGDILHAVDSPMLHTVSLSVTVPDHDTDGWTRCASVLSVRFSTSLRTLHIECVRSGIGVPDRARPFAQYIKPLLTVRQLRECAITIEDPAGVALTNEDLDTMACSWSSLAILEVAFRGGRTTVPRPPITSLPAFAYRCPGLTTLRLPISQDLTSLRSEMARTSCSQGELRDLWVAGVSFSRKETELVTKFLLRIFPNIDLLPMVNAGVLHVN
ncbi:hypothetical protein DICSQDRAFT_174640 [Dichomitus squalens LYAD-421 SS1]|uniref:F-box domain-containing protein n=1 Tax=Dichomitus squalens (strain LYAD-421) TaxID=732165 RepID=R7SKP9_DICSQ|nr:uncharacterized protein DICSQDRAFT_174640 [Dichomitus squalens LYAD-421 SS1]EJF56689.1 hypothetical protein DICSQDRAFT_174640 [Dichomitus squalens LYAD-421 SS1]